jgi:hypothetical protein
MGGQIRRLTVAALVLLSTAASVAAEPSARDFLQSIYTQYVGRDSKGVPLDKEADVRRWFAPPLSRLILLDRQLAQRRGDEVPALDGDPFVDAQDWLLSDLAITVSEAGSHATGHVSFKNIGVVKTMAVALVKVQGQWRVADITSAGSLVAYLKKATQEK